MLGVILSLAFAATASAYTLTTVTPGPGFSVTTTATYTDDGTGTCAATLDKPECAVDVNAQADGPGPYRYDHWGDTPGFTPPSYEDQQNAGYWYREAGTFRPTVKVTAPDGQFVYASPGAITVTVEPPPPVELFVGFRRDFVPRIGARSVFTAQSQRSPLAVYWKSGTTTGTAARAAECAARTQCYRILAAPAGPLLVFATAGTPSPDLASRMVTYTGPPVGSLTARLRTKRSGTRCTLTAWVTGAAGTKYRYQPTINGKKGKARRGQPRFAPISTLGKLKKTVPRGSRVVIHHRLTVGTKKYAPTPTRKRVRC